MKTVSYLAVVLAVVFIAYGNSLRNDFVWDDHDAIKHNSFITRLANIPKLASREYFLLSKELTYRPLVTLSYFFDYALWELNPAGYHLSNILLHFAACCALFFLALGLLGDRRAALAAALLFATHPANTEAVNVPAFREDVLCCSLCLAALAAWRKSLLSPRPAQAAPFYGASLAAFAAALFAKEMAMTLPLLMAAHDRIFAGAAPGLRAPREKPAQYAGHLAVLFLYAAVRFVFLRNPAETATPFLGGSFLAAASTMPKIFASYIVLLFLPFNLSAKYEILPVGNILEPDAALALVLLALCLGYAFRHRRERKAESFAIFAFFISLLPVSNLVPIVNPAAERYLYMPCAFFCLFGASALLRLSRGRIAAALATAPQPADAPTPGGQAAAWQAARMLPAHWLEFAPVAALAAVFCIATAARNADWRDSFTIWSKTAQRFPNHPDVLHELGDWHRNAGDLQRAVEYYTRALAINPRHVAVRVNLGVVYETLGMPDMALEQYNAALAINPNMSKIHNNVAIIHFKKGDIDGALAEFQKAIELDPYYPEPYVNMAILYREHGRLAESMETIQKALHMAPDNPIVKLEAGRLYLLMGNEAEAMSFFNDLLARGQEVAGVRYTLGFYYLERNMPERAIPEFVELLRVQPADFAVNTALCRAYEAAGRPDKALEHFRRLLNSGMPWSAEQLQMLKAELERLKTITDTEAAPNGA